MRKILLPFFACVCGSLTAYAAVGDTFKSNDITYKVMSETAVEVSDVPTTITEAIAIPQAVQDADAKSYTVVGIGEYAFHYTKTPGVTLPPTVTYISSMGFYNCELASIELPAALTTIGRYAFGYTKISSIDIPEGVEVLGNSAFYNCSNLVSVKLPSSLRILRVHVFIRLLSHRLNSPKGWRQSKEPYS